MVKEDVVKIHKGDKSAIDFRHKLRKWSSSKTGEMILIASNFLIFDNFVLRNNEITKTT